MGEGSTINVGTVIDNGGADVIIGRNVGIAIGVSLLTGTHDMSDPRARAGATTYLPIIIGDGAWIGTGATVLPGVTIGTGAVIAAGAVVTKDCNPDTLYAGVPARAIRNLSSRV